MALIAKVDIEAELQILLPAGYSNVTGICTWAESRLRRRTNRTAFTGDAAEDAKLAELYFAIDRLATSNRDLVKLAIANISESGTSISFSNGKTLQYYREEAERIVADLRIEGAQPHTLTFPDPDNVHTGDEGSILY